jgi:RimJ/RimL family protein N-acetyltransferase
MNAGECRPDLSAVLRQAQASAKACSQAVRSAASLAAAVPAPVLEYRRAGQAVPASWAMGSTTYLDKLEQMPDQPVGEPVPGWEPRPRPTREPLHGHFCTLEPLQLTHAAPLWNAFSEDREGRNWTYLAHGPYSSLAEFSRWVEGAVQMDDPLFYAIKVESRGPVGVAAYLRISPEAGTIEVGHIHLSPRLQRTAAATEAMFLMMAQAFALGYRRYEWKCDSLNAPSRAAAERFGFTFEGIFRQALVYKGRNRDTAWYSIIDREWPALRQAYQQWLAPSNFDDDGRQRVPLADFVNSARMSRSRA